jgi:hypothetical protein
MSIPSTDLTLEYQPQDRQTFFFTNKRPTLLNVLQENINSFNKLVDIDITIPYKIIKQDLLRLNERDFGDGT